MKKILYTLLSAAVLLTLTACDSNKSTTKNVETTSKTVESSETSKTAQKNTVKASQNLKTTKKAVQKNTNENKNSTVNYDEFFNIKNCIIENVLNIKELTDEEFILSAEGEFDINKDGTKDIINISLKCDDDGKIRINNTQISNYVETPCAVHLVDLVKDDNFIEIAITDGGSSADPYTSFYRYNGKSIEKISGGFYTEITSEDSVNVYYGQVLTNGKGMFIAPIDIVQFISPKILKAYRTLEGNKFIYHPLDYSNALNKEYTITADFDAFLNKQDKDANSSGQNNNYYYYCGEDTAKFHKGQKIKINTIKNPMNEDGWYEVNLEDGTKAMLDCFCPYEIELEDGTKGELYFWIGD